MISLVEGATRQKTPNEIALTILLSALTFIFLLVIVALKPFGIYSDVAFSITALIALLVCLIPTTIGGLLSAIGIAGMDRLLQRNVLAMSRPGRRGGRRHRRAPARQDRHDHARQPAWRPTSCPRRASRRERLADAAQLASLADETPEGRSIVVLAKEKFNLRGRELDRRPHTFVPFTAQTRMSGIDVPAHGDQPARSIRKGAADNVRGWVEAQGGVYPAAGRRSRSSQISRQGGTPLVVAEGRDRARRDLPEGRREGRDQGAVRPAARHGHPHRHDHRRQPAHRRRHRRRGGRRRFSRPGHAGDEARPHPRGADGRATSWP